MFRNIRAKRDGYKDDARQG